MTSVIVGDQGVAVEAVELIDGGLAVAWDDGHRSVFPGLWLRDNCACRECRHASGQRLVQVQNLAAAPRVLNADVTNETIAGEFGDGHRACWPVEWLRARCLCGEHANTRSRPRLWDSTIESSLPEFGLDELREWLAAVDELGFAVVRGGPATEGAVLDVIRLFGYVRETNYGRLFDVCSVVNPRNLAYTSLALAAHTDNPYRDPTPTLQLLHCLSSSTSGGDSTLVDGFRVASDLTREQFELLARHPVRFRYADEDTELVNDAPVLELDPAGELRAVRFNTRSAEPRAFPADVADAYYEAYRSFALALESPQYRITFRLEPGDLFIVDNLRVLHGRTGFGAAAGERHLQGAYADRDALRSTLAVLSR